MLTPQTSFHSVLELCGEYNKIKLFKIDIEGHNLICYNLRVKINIPCLEKEIEKMRKSTIKILGIEATINNKREERLINIINRSIIDVYNKLSDPEWKDDILASCGRHWLIKEIDGLLTACFYLGIISDSISSYGIYEAIRGAWFETQVLNEIV